MTSKDYKIIAKALKKAKPDSSEIAKLQWEVDCELIAQALADDNPNFNADKFFAACEDKA